MAPYLPPTFVCAQPVLRTPTLRGSVTPVCPLHRAALRMQAKNKSSPKKKRSAKPAGTGFANTSSPILPTTGEEPAVPSDDDTSASSSTSSLVNEATGEAGDSTPHQVNVGDVTEPKLTNPVDELKEPEPLVALPILSDDELIELRFDVASTNENLLAYFGEAQDRDDFPSVAVANRHHITEALLYRLTSMILKTESDGGDSSQLRGLRKKLVAYAWSYDFSLKRAVQLAERRLVPVLQNTESEKQLDLEFASAVGRSQLEVNAFWTVVYAAVIAWEERLRESPQEAEGSDATRARLKRCADNCREMEEVTKYLSPCLSAMQRILAERDPTEQSDIVQQLDENDYVELINFAEAVSLLPSTAYGGLSDRLRFVGDYVRSTKYGLGPLAYEPVRFTPTEIQRDSMLVEFARRSEGGRAF